MATTLAPNIEAFRAFLKSRVDQEKRVTAVTPVTAMNSSTCELQTLVTLVTEGITGDHESAEILERQAFAEIDGQVPSIFSLAFAAFQMGCPPGRSIEEWHRAIDDAGRFLDGHGQQAATLGWRPTDLFEKDGLAWRLQGGTVKALTFSEASL